jgi:DNA-binding IclR family transcriptional regulator
MIRALQALANRPVRVHLAVQTAMPMHCVAVGRIYLASLSDDELREWLKADLQTVTEHTLTSADGLFDEITTARRLGYAVTHQQALSGASGIAVLVRSPEGKAVAGLNLAAPFGQATHDNIRRWLPPMRRCAEDVSQRLHALPDQEPIAGETGSGE